MKSRYTKTICSAVLGGLLALIPAALSATELNKSETAAVLERKAKEAKTPAEHSEVARQYELRARALDVKAESIEGEVRQQKANPSAMETKWPAMVVNARERREQLAMQTRRAAQESYRLAEHHRTVAGETRASAK